MSAFGYSLANQGHRGVDIFFGISGFLICSKLVSEESKRGKINLKNFYLRRAFRILPAALIYLFVIAILGQTGVLTKMPFRELMSCIFFFRNYLPELSDITAYTGHYWSLSVEEHFYLIFPALLMCGKARRLKYLAPLLALLIGCWRVLDTHYNISTSIFSPEVVLSYHRTDRQADSLLWGCTLALWVNQVAFRKLLDKKLNTSVWLILVAMYSASCFYRIPLQGTFEAILVPLLLYGTIANKNTLIGSIFEFPLLKWVGRLSYSIYLWHSIFFVGRYHQPAILQAFPFNVIALIICASASYYFIERPLIGFGHKLTKIDKSELNPDDKVTEIIASQYTLYPPDGLATINQKR